jgi:hypothetical protein
MTYDFSGVWDADIEALGPYVKPHTDIESIRSHICVIRIINNTVTFYISVTEAAIGLFRKDGVPDEKLVLGKNL